jgi:TldD protein
LTALESLRRSAGDAARLQYVELDQQVAVACRDGRAGTDRRRGRRLRLALGNAVVERVFPGDTLDLQGLATALAARAQARTRPLRARPGRTVAVFAPGVGGVLLHELVGHALEGDVQARRASRLARAEGPVAPPSVTVLDDPRRGRIPWRMDDEGTAARPVPLLQEGRVRGSLASWGWPGTPHPSSGHARRASFAEPALPRMGATFLTPGRLHPEEVRAGVARGVYIRRMVVGTTDPAEGKATFEVTDADMLIGGQCEAPLTPFLLHASLDDLVTLDRIADDLTFDPCIGVCVREGQAMASSVGAPTFRLGLVTVQG